jgi:hypothetical protein
MDVECFVQERKINGLSVNLLSASCSVHDTHNLLIPLYTLVFVYTKTKNAVSPAIVTSCVARGLTLFWSPHYIHCIHAHIGGRRGPVCKKDKQFRAADSFVVTRVRLGVER